MSHACQADDGTITSHFWKKLMTTQDRIPGLHLSFSWRSRVFFISIYNHILFYTMLYEHIWILLNIFTQLLIHVIYNLPPLLMFLCCLVASNRNHLFCDADTLPLGYWSLWSSAYILFIKYKYVLTDFWLIYSHIFHCTARTYVQYCVRKLSNVN